MRSLNRLRYFLAQLREELGDDAVSSETLAIFRFEEFFSNDAFRINKKISRAGKALLHPRGFAVENAVGLDDLRVWISEQGIIDLAPVREKLQDLFRVIADSRQLDALLLESLSSTLQLDQLPFAEWSPIGGTEEEKNRTVPSF